MANLNNFISKNQLNTLQEYCEGEEKEHFIELLDNLGNRIDNMPKIYEQDHLGDQAIAYLHYFIGNSDWWILEKDNDESEPQYQAFGFACLNGWTDCAELGYISIEELIENDVEIDLYFQPITLGEIKHKLKII